MAHIGVVTALAKGERIEALPCLDTSAPYCISLVFRDTAAPLGMVALGSIWTPDADYAARLVEAINGAAREPAAKVIEHDEVAA